MSENGDNITTETPKFQSSNDLIETIRTIERLNHTKDNNSSHLTDQCLDLKQELKYELQDTKQRFRDSIPLNGLLDLLNTHCEIDPK